jgi:hypothetical protein
MTIYQNIPNDIEMRYLFMHRNVEIRFIESVERIEKKVIWKSKKECVLHNGGDARKSTLCKCYDYYVKSKFANIRHLTIALYEPSDNRRLLFMNCF